jgi:hypothetical protein
MVTTNVVFTWMPVRDFCHSYSDPLIVCFLCCLYLCPFILMIVIGVGDRNTSTRPQIEISFCYGRVTKNLCLPDLFSLKLFIVYTNYL